MSSTDSVARRHRRGRPPAPGDGAAPEQPVLDGEAAEDEDDVENPGAIESDERAHVAPPDAVARPGAVVVAAVHRCGDFR